jgi:hypothetical protein
MLGELNWAPGEIISVESSFSSENSRQIENVKESNGNPNSLCLLSTTACITIPNAKYVSKVKTNE